MRPFRLEGILRALIANGTFISVWRQQASLPSLTVEFLSLSAFGASLQLQSEAYVQSNGGEG
jgi:hypothetical protein